MHVIFADRTLQKTGKLELGPARSKIAAKENLKRKSFVPQKLVQKQSVAHPIRSKILEMISLMGFTIFSKIYSIMLSHTSKRTSQTEFTT